MFGATCLHNSTNSSLSSGPDLRLKTTALLFQLTCCMLDVELEPRLATQLSLFLVIFLTHNGDLNLRFGAKAGGWVFF